jgi:hypothetical protein
MSMLVVSYSVIYSKTSSINWWLSAISRNMRHSSDKNQNCWIKKSADRICGQNANLLTKKICWRNQLTKTNLLTREICWQKLNLLTTKKQRINSSRFLQSLNILNSSYRTKLHVFNRACMASRHDDTPYDKWIRYFGRFPLPTKSARISDPVLPVHLNWRKVRVHYV